MEEKYCEKLKEITKKKEFEKKQILDELVEVKLEWNYPKIKNYETKSDLILSQLHLITLIIKNMEIKCPKDTWTEDSCNNNCKELYESTIKILKCN
jgi:hypothetical protein